MLMGFKLKIISVSKNSTSHLVTKNSMSDETLKRTKADFLTSQIIDWDLLNV